MEELAAMNRRHALIAYFLIACTLIACSRRPRCGNPHRQLDHHPQR